MNWPLLVRVPYRACNRRAAALATLALAFFASTPLFADTVTRRDGATVEGEVIGVDAASVTVRTPGGLVRLSRSEVASIHFQEPSPPLKVEIRNVRSDDAIDVLLEDEVVIRDAREGGEWVDLTPKLKEGNNPLRLKIRNDRAVWAYRLSLRINGKVTSLACGTPTRNDDPCRCCGKVGREIGVIDDLPVIWIHVDRSRGSAEVLP